MTEQPMQLDKKSGIKSIALIQSGDGEPVQRTVLAEVKRKRVSKRWRKMEKWVRRLNKSQAITAREYMARHDRSNQKKKNGWLKDIGKNLSKAQKKGLRKSRFRIF